MKHQKGLILIELIMTLVLVGIIATFTGFFIYSGINGYLKAKYITNGSMDTQRALDRISLELRSLDYFTSAPVLNTSITYKSTESELPGTRILRYDAANNAILIGNVGGEQPLLENIKSGSFKLAVKDKDLDNDGSSDDIEAIEVEFNIVDIGTSFKTRIFPRNLVEKTW
jgi:prepilin-type N-terminal cleavage/methylation domain-containing protein